MERCHGFPWVTSSIFKRVGSPGAHSQLQITHWRAHLCVLKDWTTPQSAFLTKVPLWSNVSCCFSLKAFIKIDRLKWKIFISAHCALHTCMATTLIAVLIEEEGCLKDKWFFHFKAQWCSIDGRCLCFSVETRKDKATPYSALLQCVPWLKVMLWDYCTTYTLYINISNVHLQGNRERRRFVNFMSTLNIYYYCWCTIGTINLKILCACNATCCLHTVMDAFVSLYFFDMRNVPISIQ